MEWPEPWSRLAACGWTTARLATLDDLPKRGLCELLEKAFGREATVEELEEFFQKVKECGSTGRIQWGVEGRSGGLDWVAAGFKRARIFRREMVAEVVDLEAPPCRKGKAPLARWPCRLSRLVGRAGNNMDLRDRAERSERTRWTVMLKRIIVESELPARWDGLAQDRKREEIYHPAEARQDLAACCHVVVQHLQCAMAADHRAVHRVHHASGCRAVRQEYPHKFDEDPDVHRGGWGGAGEGKALQAPALQNTLKEVNLELGSLDLRGRRQAVQIPVEIIMAMERYVMTEGVPRYPRAYAWFRLVKLWGALRFSDTQGMPFGKLEMSGRGLRGVLERTKTTGAGKKVEIQHVFISVEAWLEEPRWLGVGCQLWKTMSEEAGLFNRDFTGLAQL